MTKQEIVDIIENTGKVERSFTESDRASRRSSATRAPATPRGRQASFAAAAPGLAQDQSMEATRAGRRR